MSIGPVIHLASGYLQSLFSGAAAGSSTGNATSTESNQPSSFAQILNSLQDLEHSSPSQYRQVTHQIASKLETASRSATAAGNAALGSRLSQLSADFNRASGSGQLPNAEDLVQAIGVAGKPPGHTNSRIG